MDNMNEMNENKMNTQFIIMLYVSTVLFPFSYSTKRVDHSNTKLSTQLEKNPGKSYFHFPQIWKFTWIISNVHVY